MINNIAPMVFREFGEDNEMTFWSQSLPDGRTLRAELIGGELYLSDSAGTEYDPAEYGDSHERFFEDEAAVAGFDDDAPAGAADLTTFWDYLRSKATVDRALTVKTYGNKFKNFRNYAGVDRSFNALVICSAKPKHVDLRHARGTDAEVQKCVQAGRRFEEVLDSIVSCTERDNLRSIGIYCRAGHHRSVACAELLRTHVYRRAAVEHLTIRK